MPVVQDVLDSLKEIEALHRKKNDDYASTNNPFSNFDVSEYGLKLFTNPRDGAFIWPIFTKLSRLSTLLNSNKIPNNESVEDSLLDIATYILLWKADIKNRTLNLVSTVSVPLCSVHALPNCSICRCEICGIQLYTNTEKEFHPTICPRRKN
jgi:hypothetical protein